MQQPVTDQESLTILCQSLDALTFVHELGIVHRDIKPENILVRSRNLLHIKLSDFGLSKATTDLQTFCGTPLFAALEIYTKIRAVYYTKACDIWSLGVVILKYAYGPLPDIQRSGVGLAWCKSIIKQIDDWDSDILLDFLSTAMLIIKPEKRLLARSCWEQAIQLHIPSQRRSPTPTPASYSASHGLKGISDLCRTPTSVMPPYSGMLRVFTLELVLLSYLVTYLSLPQAQDHLSTRSLRFDCEGLVYMVIRGQAVSMRTLDFKLDATQICNAARFNANQRKSYITILKGHCVVTQMKSKGERHHSWIPFKDGVFLCKVLKLYDEMKPLLSQSAEDVPRDEDNYFLNQKRAKPKLPDGYKALEWEGKTVIYMPALRKIHATQVLHLGNIPSPSAQLARFLSCNEISKQVVRGHIRTQGTYIDFEDARLLCRHFNLSEAPLDAITQRERTPEIPLWGELESAAPIYHGSAFNIENQGIPDGDMYWGQMLGSSGHPVDGPATATMELPPYNDSQARLQLTEAVSNVDDYSQITERDYEYGSFLAPADTSYLQLVDQNELR